MRLRVLLTNGNRTVDLIWLKHNGTDVYYGGVGWNDKTSYHASGKRHTKTTSGDKREIFQHHPLNNFKGQLQLCAFCFSKDIVESADVTEYTGRKGDSVIYLDARTMPDQVNISLGLVEVGNYNSILPVHEIVDLHLVYLVTNTVPWIYVMVADVNRLELPSSNLALAADS